MTGLALAVLTAMAALAASTPSAIAQSLYVRGAKPGTDIELFVNTTNLGAAKADGEGVAQVPGRQPSPVATDTPAVVMVDTCGGRQRIIVVLSGADSPPPDEACTRVDVAGIYVVRAISTLVVNVAGPRPTLLLVQGKYDPEEAAESREWGPAPTGVILSGAPAFTWWSDAGLLACGNVSGCEADTAGIGFTGGATFWLKPFIGVEGAYLWPGGMHASGSGSGFTFESDLDADILTLAGVIGIPAGPTRIFGKGGANYHRATFTTVQTNEPLTYQDDDGNTITIAGGTQTLDLQTSGWGWMFGGGLEAWISKRWAVYGELTMLGIKGNDRLGGEGLIDDRLTTVFVGARFKLGKK